MGQCRRGGRGAGPGRVDWDGPEHRAQGRKERAGLGRARQGGRHEAAVALRALSSGVEPESIPAFLPPHHLPPPLSHLLDPSPPPFHANLSAMPGIMYPCTIRPSPPCISTLPTCDADGKDHSIRLIPLLRPAGSVPCHQGCHVAGSIRLNAAHQASALQRQQGVVQQ